MKRAFIRALWGITETTYDEGWNTPSERRKRLGFDIDNILCNINTVPFVTYVFGNDNYTFLQSKGIKPVLINERPFVYDLQTQFWRHKLDILKAAMEEYDEIVYLDWDCIPQKPMSELFWDSLSSKKEIQANLQMYTRRKCFWRQDNLRLVSNGGFLYIRDRTIPEKLIKTWEGMEDRSKFWDEVAISKYIDGINGKWCGLNYYLENFEPDVCKLKKKSAFDEEINNKKDVFFVHFIQSNNNREAKSK